MYVITSYTKRKAKQLGVKVFPSSLPTKKIDVYKNDKKICSIGGEGYMDYPNYVAKYGKKVADQKRRMYALRHHRDRNVVGSPGWYAWKLLW